MAGKSMSLMTFLLLTLMLVPFTAMGEPAAQIIPDDKELGCPKVYPFKEDNLKVILRDGNKKLVEFSFCSSYGEANAALERDAKGNLFLLLRIGEGRGTNARSEFLSVYKVSPHMVEYVRVPISGPAGFVSGWSYDYQLLKPASGGLELTLLLKVEGEGADFVPSERKRIITVR